MSALERASDLASTLFIVSLDTKDVAGRRVNVVDHTAGEAGQRCVGVRLLKFVIGCATLDRKFGDRGLSLSGPRQPNLLVRVTGSWSKSRHGDRAGIGGT